MSDRVTQFKQILDEASDIVSIWNSMQADLGRCKVKLERLQVEMVSAQDAREAANLVIHYRYLAAAAQQYEQQLQNFPGRLAAISQKCVMLPLSASDASVIKPSRRFN